MNIVLTSILSSATATALVVAIKEIILWRLNRKAKVEDKAEAKNDATEELLEEMKTQNEELKRQNEELQRLCAKILDLTESNQQQIKIQSELINKIDGKVESTIHGNKVLLLDKIKYLALCHIKKKSITFEDRKILHEMWEIYHYKMGGNGDLDDIMKSVDSLQIDL